jgi:hypothetical protein
MRRAILLLAVPLALACHDANNPTDPVPASTTGLRILGGTATCDACTSVTFDVAGPDLESVVSAAFLRKGTALLLRANIGLRRFTGDSGVVLRAEATFSDTVLAGDYDLRLTMLPTNGVGTTRVIPAALQVTRSHYPNVPGPPGPPPPPSPPPPSTEGTLRVSVTATGESLPGTVWVSIQTMSYYSYHGDGGPVTPGQSVEWRLPVGNYYVTLSGLPANCRVVGMATLEVSIATETTTEVEFTVNCSLAASIRMSLSVTGETPFSYPFVVCQFACGNAALSPDTDAVLTVEGGSYLLQIQGVAPHCRVTGSSTVPVTVAPGETATVQFAITCDPYAGTVRATVRAHGTNVDPSFLVGDITDCYYWYYCDVDTTVPAGGSVELRVPPGTRYIKLDGVAGNCSVRGSTTATLLVATGATVEVAWDVDCR